MELVQRYPSALSSSDSIERDLPRGFFRQSGRNMIYLAFREKGHRYTVPTGISEPAPISVHCFKTLEKFRIGQIAKVQNRPDAPVSRSVRVEDLLNDYVAHLRKKEAAKGEYTTGERTWADRVESINRNNLIPFFGRLKPEHVKSKLDEYKDKLEANSTSPATMNGHFRVLSAAMIRGWKNDKVAHADLPKEYPFDHDGERDVARTGTISEDDIAKLTPELAPHLRALFLACVYAGARPKELRWVSREDVILTGDAPRIIVRKHKTVGKTRKPKVLAIVDELLPVLKEWEQSTVQSYPAAKFFFHCEGDFYGSYRTAWYAALKRAGIPVGKILFYDARRTARTALSQAGVSQEDAKKQLGHSTDAMSDLYNQDSVTHVKRIRQATSKTPAKPVASAPTASNSDWKAELKELKALLDDGILTQTEFDAEKAKVLASRSAAA